MKTRILTLFAIFFSLASVGYGQVTEAESKLRDVKTDSITGWKMGGVAAVNLSQTSLTNWAAGGQNSFAVNGMFSVFANYKAENTVWDNSLDMGYGLLKQGKNSDYMKTDDKSDFLSKYGKRAYHNFYYAALLNLKTQMTVGKDYAKDTAKISNFFAPAYIVGALGMDYKPNKYFSAFVAPVTGKITLVNDQDLADAGAYGVDAAVFDEVTKVKIKDGANSKSEFGGYIRVIYTKSDFENEFMKNISFTTKIDLFSNYEHKPQNIDVSWETLVTMKVNKYISVNLNTHLIYDDDIFIGIDDDGNGTIDRESKKVQFKEILGVGIAYKF